MKAGVAVDDWKLPVFRKLLTEAGFEFKEGPGLTADTSFLTVETPSAAALIPTVEKCQAECRKSKLS